MKKSLKCQNGKCDTNAQRRQTKHSRRRRRQHIWQKDAK